MDKLREKFKSNHFRHGTLATALTALFLALLILVNVIAGIAVERWDLKVDLTSSGVYELSEETKAALDTIDVPITVTVLSTELEFISQNDYFAQANETIKLFTKHNPNITVEYVDPIKDPAILTQYSDFGATTKDIIIKSPIRTLYVSYLDLFNITIDSTGSFYEIASSKAEYSVATAIMGSVVTTQPSVVVLTGHGEDELPQLVSYLTTNNFKTGTADLTTSGIPADTDVVVIGNPTVDFTETDLRRLDEFLFNNGDYGKHLVYFANSTQGELPNLEAFLSDWGIDMQQSTLLEMNQDRIYNYDFYFAQTDYAEHEIAGSLATSNIRPAIRLSKGMIAKGNAEVLLAMSNTSVQVPADAGKEVDVSKYEKAAWPVAIMGTRSTTDAESHVIAFGSTNFVAESLLKNTAVTNGDYVLNLFNYLTNRDDAVPMTTKTLGGTHYSITSGQSTFLTILFLGIVPLAVMTAGTVVWFRRRHL